MSKAVLAGLDVLAATDFASLSGVRVGLLTHAPAVDRRLRSAASLFASALGPRLVRLFAPEHGLHGLAQDLEGVADDRDPETGLNVVSLYGASSASLRPTSSMLNGLDLL